MLFRSGVAELGSFRAAADAVHLSQPALSRRVGKLEQALGVRLFERTTRRVSLTAVGREFARKARATHAAFPASNACSPVRPKSPRRFIGWRKRRAPAHPMSRICACRRR